MSESRIDAPRPANKRPAQQHRGDGSPFWRAVRMLTLICAVWITVLVTITTFENSNRGAQTHALVVHSNITLNRIDRILNTVQTEEVQIKSVTGPAAQKRSAQALAHIYECLYNIGDTFTGRPPKYPVKDCP